ncbi:dephospho-CoA kinase [Epidermidibacterium keratini]|uniref:Dephospho-CoA kinase n=1 Tax=Epidermidibacterium keratini TaxID=1891644 RepID=A0A7L4YVH1_9ACTN|nr:dephospho-CoA kinase [Epidermidibacterium keratini]
MLNIGLTGGIGSGKSAVSERLDALGAVVVDADKIAREVVEPGTEGLAAVVAEFGEGILREDGALDRPALAAIVFDDDSARAKLNAIVHPAVRARSAELIEAAGPEAIIVNDIPLLAEGQMAPAFHLVIVVDTPADVRLERLVAARGMNPEDVKARIASQASDEQRRAIADVVIDNSGTQQQLDSAVEMVWTERITPYAANIAAGQAAEPVPPVDADAWQRVEARLRVAVEPSGGVVSHHSEGFDIDAGAANADEVQGALSRAGWFPVDAETYRSADPDVGYRVRALWNASR